MNHSAKHLRLARIISLIVCAALVAAFVLWQINDELFLWVLFIFITFFVFLFSWIPPLLFLFLAAYALMPLPKPFSQKRRVKRAIIVALIIGGIIALALAIVGFVQHQPLPLDEWESWSINPETPLGNALFYVVIMPSIFGFGLFTPFFFPLPIGFIGYFLVLALFGIIFFRRRRRRRREASDALEHENV